MVKRLLLMGWLVAGLVIFLSLFFWRAQGSQALADDIKINEFFPNPPGSSEAGAEFIELINTGSDAIDIGGWKVDDVDGYIFDKKIEPNPAIFPITKLI